MADPGGQLGDIQNHLRIGALGMLIEIILRRLVEVERLVYYRWKHSLGLEH